MKVAITGSHGLIGTALVASLEGDGHTVVRVPRSGGGLDVSVLAGCDAAVHLAGPGIGDERWSPARKREVLEARADGTAAVAAACAADDGPRVLLSGSAIGYYGDRGDEVLTEASSSGDLFLSEICRRWEAAAQPAVDAGVRVAFLRTGLVLAPRGGALGKMLPLFKAGLGGRFGSGKQWWSWVSLADEVGAIRFLLDHDVAGPVNLTGPEPVTNAELAKALGEVLHRPALLPVPAFGPGLLLGRELAHELLYAGQRVEPAVLAREGFAFEHPDVRSALRWAVG